MRGLSTELLTDGVRLRPGYAIIKVAPNVSQSDGGIEYAELDRPMQSWGLLKLLGPPETTLSGHPIAPGCEEHDWVLFNRWAARHFDTTDGDTLALVRQEDILAVIVTEES